MEDEIRLGLLELESAKRVLERKLRDILWDGYMEQWFKMSGFKSSLVVDETTIKGDFLSEVNRDRFTITISSNTITTGWLESNHDLSYKFTESNSWWKGHDSSSLGDILGCPTIEEIESLFVKYMEGGDDSQFTDKMTTYLHVKVFDGGKIENIKSDVFVKHV